MQPEIDMTHFIGKTVNDFTISSILGYGGQSVIYTAEHEKYDEPVVLKATAPQFIDDPELLRRFQIEAVIFFRLKHPNIVELYDYWRDDNGIWLAMKYMQGGNLRESLKKSPWDLERTATMLDQVTSALAFTHEHNVIHRDIKPDNILFDLDGTAYVHDFGVAKRLKAEEITSMDMMIGSPAYYSPEQILKKPISPQTDVYILGITLYEALTGKHPYIDAVTKMQIILKHLQIPLPDICKARPDIPASVRDILKKATAKAPEERYPSVTELAEAFRQAVESR